MSSFSVPGGPGRPSGPGGPRGPRDPFRRGFSGSPRTKAILPTIVVLIVIGVLFAVFTSFWTDRLWFGSIGYSQVFSTTLVTKIGLFAVFGLVFAIAVFANLAIAHKLRPRYRAMSSEQQTLDRYRDVIDPHKKLVGLVLASILGLIAGSSAASRWDTFLAWTNAQAFGVKDKQFGVDVSFYVFGYPWYRFLLGFGFAVVVLSAVAAVVAHYLYGGIRLQTQGQKATAAAQAHISVLVGLFILLKAVAYWFDRFGLVLGNHRFSNGTLPFTGMTYSDAHAMLPAKTILTFIALICALLFFANVVRRTWLLPGLGLGLLLLAAVLLGWAWPAIVQGVTVRPNEPDKERPFIAENIQATRKAFGVGGVKPEPYEAKTTVEKGTLTKDDKATPGVRLIDPTIVRETYQQLEQVRGYYTFPDPLDVDRYAIDKNLSDAVVAVRELDLEGLPDDQRNWNNDHTVYTHGYGLVAAYGAREGDNGRPDWMESGLPPTGALGKFEPRIYFGEFSPSYSIVGGPSGKAPIEVDVPNSEGKDTTYTYEGKGGVPIGSFFNRVLFASKFQDFNFLLSGRINSDSKILYDRSPKERVQKVAPWLNVDSDPYPAIVNGKIKWIVDGYTMTDQYPMSQRKDLSDSLSDSVTPAPAIAGQPGEQTNYVRNSVKATVDAYDGSVDLYAWDTSDPILKTWMKAFPGVVKPKSAAPSQLLDHVRYPLDMMKLQREILAQYHVTDPKTFYDGSQRWRVPADPANKDAKQPPYYLSVKMPGEQNPTFSLTSTYIFNKRLNLAAFMAADGDARSPTYGRMRVLRITGVDDGKSGKSAATSQGQVDGPSQIANEMDGDPEVKAELLKWTGSAAGGGASSNKVRHGNLLTLPVGDGLLYVQPIYVERKGEGAFPLLRLVQASFGERIGVGANLEEALAMIEGSKPNEQPPPDDSDTPPVTTGPVAKQVLTLWGQAYQSLDKAEQARLKGDLAAYQKYVSEAKQAMDQAQKLQKAEAGKEPEKGSGDGKGAGGGKKTPTPTPTPPR